MDYADIRSLAESCRGDLVSFAQKLVQTPSLPGQEGDVAELLVSEMTQLGYDKVWVDEAGNVGELSREVSASAASTPTDSVAPNLASEL